MIAIMTLAILGGDATLWTGSNPTCANASPPHAHRVGADSKVTLNAGPMLASDWVKELSKATGMSFRVAGSVRDDVLFTAVKDVDLERLKEEVAAVVEGEWRETGEGYELVRTAETEAAQVRRARERRRKRFEAALAKVRERAAAPFDAEALAAQAIALAPNWYLEDEDQRLRLNQSSPIGRLLVRLLGDLDASRLAAYDGDARLVFARSPTRRQLALGPGTDAAIRQFVREQTSWAVAVAKRKIEIPEDVPPDNPLYTANPSSAPSNFFVELRLIEDFPYLTAHLYFLDHRKPTLEASYELVLQDGDDLESKAKRRGGSGEAILLNLSPVSEDCVAFARTLFAPRMARRGGPARLKRETIAEIVRPERFDPTCIVLGDLLAQMAERSNVVASIPEMSSMAALRASLVEPLTVGAVRETLVGEGLWTIDESDGWTLVRPTDPAEDRRRRTPRPVLGEFLRSLVAHQDIRLRDCAKLAAYSAMGRMPDLSVFLATLIEPEAVSTYLKHDRTALRLYGSIVDDAAMKARRTGEWRLANLNPTTRSLLEAAVYGDADESAEDDERVQVIEIRPRLEPTIEYPNGLPADAIFQVSEESDDVLVTYTMGWTGWVAKGIASPADIASSILARESDADHNWEAWAVAKRRRIRFRIILAEHDWRQWSLTHVETAPWVDPVDWVRLPEPIRKEVEIEVSRMRERDPGLEHERAPSQQRPPR